MEILNDIGFFLFGAGVGTFIGVLVMALCQISGKDRRDDE